MKKCVKFLTGVLTAVTLVVGLMPTTVVKAETAKKTYTVTFRAGNVGAFNQDAENIVNDNIEVTENYIKFTVPKGESLSSTFDFISDDSGLEAYFLNATSQKEGTDLADNSNNGYRLKSVTDWAAGAAEATVNRNTEYVLDYAKLVNPVKYVIRFVDRASGEQIAPSTIAYGNAEEEILCTPLTITGYSTEDKAVNLVLKESDENVNEVTFQYTYSGERDVVTNTVTNYEPGETITETVVNDVTVDAVDDAAVAQPVQGAAIAQPVQDAAAAQQADENGVVQIPEGDVPLADDNEVNENEQQGENDIVNIEEEETPLAANQEKESNSYWIPVASGAAVAVLLIASVLVFLKKKSSLKNK